MKLSLKKMASLMLVPALMLVLGAGGIIGAPAYAAKGDTCTTSDGKAGVIVDDAGTCKSCDVAEGISGALSEACSKGKGQSGQLFGTGGIVTTIINAMLFIVGILCVVMIIFGGIRYTTSTGDKGRVDAAKNTIIYAVVGLIVAIVAYALVNWVFNAFQ